MSLQEIVGWIASSAAGERAGWVIVHSLWQFAAVAILAAVARRALASASALLRYRVLTGALLVMAALPVATWLSLPAPTQATLPAAGDAGTRTTPQASALAARLTMNSAPAAVAFVRVPAPTEPAQEVVTVRSLALALSARIRPWMGWIVAAWALGVVFFSLRPLVGWLAWRRLTRIGVAPVPDFIEAIAVRAAMQLGVPRPVMVLASSIARVPAVAGWLRPVILVPTALVTTLPIAELEAILVHELVHVRRGDFLVNVLQMAIEALGFYHPAVWWLSRKIREARELACDDLVLAAGESPLAYGRALVAVEELRSRPPAFALGASDGSLVARIRRITRLDPEPARASAWPLSALVAAGCVAATLLLLPGGPLAPSHAVAADAAADLPDLLTVKELTEAQAWAIVEAQAKKPPLEGKTLGDQLAALATKGASPDDLAAVWKSIAWQTSPFYCVTQPQHPLEPSLYPHGFPTSVQRAANQFRGFLFLPALATMSPEVAAALADHQGQLHLPGLTALVPDAAGMFADYTGYAGSHLDISGLETLPVETAQILSRSGCQSIALPAVPLEPNVVEALGAFEGEISFPRIETLTPQAATLIVAKPGLKLLPMLANVTSLPPDAAAVLASFGDTGGTIDLAGLTRISAESAAALAPFSGRLVLSGLRDLSPDVAAALAKFAGGDLGLSGVRTLTPEAAAALAEYAGSIDLSGLSALSPETARALAPCSGSLDLSGIRDLSPEVAQGFDGCSATLCLSGVERLSADAAEALAGFAGEIDLSGVESLTPDAAEKLATAQGVGLRLDGLAELTPDLAEKLAARLGTLSLAGVRTLTPDVARALAKHAGGLDLGSVTAITPDVAHLLAGCNGMLSLGLVELSPEVAKALAAHVGTLYLGGLREISADAARPLASHAGRISVPDIVEASPEVRKLLAMGAAVLPYAIEDEDVRMLTAKQAEEYIEKPNPVQMSRVVELSAEAAQVLAAGSERLGRLSFESLKTISPEVAAALATSKGHLVLGLEELSPEVATELAKRTAAIEFPRLAAMSPEAARALSGRGGWLSLPAFTTLPVDVAAWLVKSPQPVAFDGLETLSPQTAAALATGDRQMNLWLHGLRSLTPEAAAALAYSHGSLSLGLRSLSPEVAAALAPCPATLGLDSVTWLSPEAAAALSRRKGDLVLGLRTLSPEVARGLARCQGALYLDGVKVLSAEAARALAPCKDYVALRGLTAITPDVAEALDFPGSLDLMGLQSLSADVARALARRKGPVILHGVTKLTPDVAAMLVEGTSVVQPHFDLRGLIALDPETVTALAKAAPGQLNLDGVERSVTTLSPDLARLLVNGFHWEDAGLRLESIKTLDGIDAVDVAKILATAKCQVALPALARISRPALEALRAKPCIQLPEEKTLELVP